MAKSELILSPKINESALRKTQKKIEEALSKAGQQGAADVKEELHDNVRKGVSDGLDDAFDKAAFYGKIAVLADVIMSVIGDAIEKTFGGFDEAADRIMQRMEMIKEIQTTGATFGISAGKYGALLTGAQALGLDAGDIRGMLSGFVQELKDAGMTNYEQLASDKGTELAFLNLLKTASEKSPLDAQKFLGFLGDEDAVLAGKMAGIMREMSSKGLEITSESFAQYMAGAPISSAAIEKGIQASQPGIRQINRYQSQRMYRDLADRPITAGKGGDLARGFRSTERVADANESVLSLKTDAKIFADSLTVKEIQATAKLVTPLIENLKTPVVTIAEPGVVQALQDPNPKGTQAAFNEAQREIWKNSILKAVIDGLSDLLDTRPATTSVSDKTGAAK